MIKLMDDVCVCQRLPEETKKNSLFGVFKLLTWSKSWSLSLFSAASLAPRSRVVCWHCIILACNRLPISIKCHTYLMSDRLNHFNLTKSAFTSSMARWVSVIFFSFPSFSPWWDLQKSKRATLYAAVFVVFHRTPKTSEQPGSSQLVHHCSLHLHGALKVLHLHSKVFHLKTIFEHLCCCFPFSEKKITPPCRQAPSPHPSGCNRSSPKFPDSVEKSSSVSEKLNFTIYSSVSENVYQGHKLIKNTWPSWRTDRLYRCHFVVQLLDLLPLLLFFGHHVLKIF